MPLKLFSSTAVIAASQFNPSVVNQVWLIQNGLVALDDFKAGCVFTDMLVQVHSSEFNLLVTPEQCQLTPRTEQEREGEVVKSTLGQIAELLPHTPFRGLGLNFVWHALAAENDVQAMSRRLFFVESSPLHSEFDTDDAMYGGYLSKNTLGCRLKLDIKPGAGHMHDGSKIHFIQFAFNYHLDLGADAVVGIQQILSRWNDAREQSAQVTKRSTGMEVE